MMKKLIIIINLFFLYFTLNVLAQQETNTFYLEDSPLIVIKPREIQYTDFIFSIDPALNFLLLAGPYGGIPSKPSFTIEKFIFTEKPEIKSMEGIKEFIKQNPNKETQVLYSFSKLNSYEVVEIIGVDKHEVHELSDAGIGKIFNIEEKYYKLIIEYNGKLYSCVMLDNLEKFNEHISIAKELCYSIKFVDKY